MNYLIYSNTGLSSKQVGLTAQFVKDCVSNNIRVKIVKCDNVLENCFFNPLHSQLGCAICQSRSSELYKQIGVKKSDFINLKQMSFEYDCPEFLSLDELMDYRFEGVNIGRGVASSILSYYKDHVVNSEKYGDLINLELKKAVNVYLNFKKIIKQERPDKVVFFNGRFSEVMPLFDYCKVHSIDFSVIEAGAKDNYELYHNCFPHSIEFRTKSTIELWESNPNKAERDKIGHEWFRKKRFGDESFEKSFTKHQKTGELPPNFDSEKHNILIMNSSEDEMKVIGEWKTNLYNNQNEALLKVLENFKDSSNIHFFLRAHPNLDVEGNIQMKEVYEMNFSNFTVIKPHEKIDTYALIDSCDKVITFGSTSGIEATYWGKPSILIGKSFYYLLPDTVYKPKSYPEIFNLVAQEDLVPLSQDACLPYGYYYSKVGIESSDFKYNGLNNSTFKGKRIRKWYPSTVFLAVKYLFQFKKWGTAYRAVTGNRWKLRDFFRYKI